MKSRFFLSVLIPMLILVAMTVQPLLTLYYGQEFKIMTQPVDPVDLFRGDHVILNYEINDLTISQFPELEKDKASLRDHETSKKYLKKEVYVTLREDNGIYVAESAGFSRPAKKLYLTGRISRFFNKVPVGPFGESGKPPTKTDMDNPDAVRVEYQLDKYFVPENTGQKLEELSRQGQLVATVKAYKGYASLLKIEKANNSQ